MRGDILLVGFIISQLIVKQIHTDTSLSAGTVFQVYNEKRPLGVLGHF